MSEIKLVRSSGAVQFIQPNTMADMTNWVRNEIGVLSGIEYKFYSYFTGLSNGDSKEYLFSVPKNVYVGLRGIIIKAEAECELRLWKDPTLTSNGTDISDQIINENLTSSNTSQCSAYEDPVYTDEGDIIDIDYAPGNSNVTYIGGLLGDMMLVSGETLLYQIKNVSGGTMSRATIKMLFREWDRPS